MCLPARVALLGNYKGKPEPCMWHRRRATGGSLAAWPSHCLPPPLWELCAAQHSPRAGSPVHMGQATAAGALCSVLYWRKVNCQSCKGEAYSLLTIFNLKMQMLLVSRSLIRVPLCHALTSIREDYENIATLAFYKCHYDSTCCTNAWLSHWGLSPGFFLRMQTNKPRNYNCLPAESVIGGNNDISALLISLPPRLAPSYWVTCHTPLWWGEFNLSAIMTMEPF